MKMLATTIIFECILSGYVQATFFCNERVKMTERAAIIVKYENSQTSTSGNRCLQNPDFNIVHPFLHFDVVIKQNEKQKRHTLVDYYPARSDCSCPCLTEIPNAEGEVGSREENKDVCQESERMVLEF